MSKEIKQCPEFPYFGAPYNDATCIDGFLHDMDNSPGHGQVYLNDNYIPCPFCNRTQFIKYHTDALNDMPRKKVVEWADKLKEKYSPTIK